MVRCAKQYSTVCTSTGTYSRRFTRRETFHNFGQSQASIADIIKRPSFSRRSGPPGFFTPAAFIKSNIIHCTCHPPSLFRKYYHPSTPASSQKGAVIKPTCEHPVPPTLCRAGTMQAFSRYPRLPVVRSRSVQLVLPVSRSLRLDETWQMRRL